MKTSKSILDPNLGAFVQTVIEHALQGWTIQESNPPSLLGFYYETVMERDEDIVDPPAKPSRAEILAKARAAKAALKAGPVSEEATQTSDSTDEEEADDQQRSEAEATGA